MTATGLHCGFLRSAERHAERPALEVCETTLSYAALLDRASIIAATLQRAAPAADPPLTAVFAQRSATNYAAILAVLMRGHGYVPLTPSLPDGRNRTMLQRARCSALVADLEGAQRLEQVVAGAPQSITILVPDLDDVAELAERLPGHRVIGAAGLAPAADCEVSEPSPEALAYLLFTSGSTGTPKGVMVAHRNVAALLRTLVERFEVDEHDRISQTHEMIFDVSVSDCFAAWERGACVCVPSAKQLIAPARFIRDSELTIWSSVPSTAIMMRRLGMLKPRSYPSLRWSLFAGEPLPVDVAEAWQRAAPGARVENLYGPTELTVVCVGHRWDPERSPAQAEAGIVPIGTALGASRTLVVDDKLVEVSPGRDGELLVSGPQVTLGYWEDEARTAQSFVVPPGHSDVHYRTGDRVRRPRHAAQPITYLGRLDQQIKVRGVRIELGEVEAAVREESGVDAVVALGWPVTVTGADGVETFIGDPDVDVAALRERLIARLPAQMVPRRIHGLDSLPLNPSGKYDRPALLARLERQEAR